MIEFITSLIAYWDGFFQVLFAVPILGILLLLGTIGPLIIVTIKTVWHRRW